MRTEDVITLVHAERVRQDVLYADNNIVAEWGTGPDTRWLGPFSYEGAKAIEQAFRDDYEDFEEETGAPTWVHLIREEVAEAFMCSDPDRLREELVQVAALCIAWIEQLP